MIFDHGGRGHHASHRRAVLGTVKASSLRSDAAYAALRTLTAPARSAKSAFQQLFFPDGISFDGNGFVGTAVTAPAFSYLRSIEDGNERMVDQNNASWNRLTSWLRKIEALRVDV